MSKNIDVEKLNLAKAAKCMTIKQIADKAGLSESAVSKVFSGLNDNPTLDTLQGIAKVLDCIVDDFLFVHEEQEYYSDRRVAALAEELRDNPEKRMLLDASRDLTTEDINAVVEIMNRLKKAKS